MAIQFARLQYVQRSKGQSSCQRAAYNGRTNIYDLRQELNYDYSNRGDGVYHTVMLPEGVSEKYTNIADLWNTIESIEVRINSQVAKEMVLALPNDDVVSLDDKIALVHSFLDKHFVQHGIICQVDIHAPHGKEEGSRWQKGRDHVRNEDDDCQNWHAHVLMPTRVCHDELFGEKARHLDVDVRQGRVVDTDKQWGALWATHQNAYFKENDIDLVVDPIGIVSELYVKNRFKSKNLDSLKQESRQENRRQSQDERLVLQHLLSHDSVFEKQDVDRFVNKHVQENDREDFLGRFWSSKELVLVKEDQYTSKAVLREEQKMIRVADRLASKTNFIVDSQREIDLNETQGQVVDYVYTGPNLSCVEGKAGTEKDLTLRALREAYEEGGFVVRGLAPRCSRANDMAQKDGFEYGVLVQKFLFDHHRGKIEIQRGQEVWIIDEATKISNPVMGELLDKAWRYDAKVVLIGDENQLCLNGRSGAFKALTERFGSRDIQNHVLQKDDAHGRIIEEIAAGEISDALFGKMELESWRHHSTEREAVCDLVNTWYAHYKENPTASFMILEQRDQYVKVLNENIHTVLRKRGELGHEDVFIQTAQYGAFEHFCTGDKIIFRADDKELGINEGQAGFLISAKPDEFVVRVNDDLDITFDPHQYNDIQYGYAVNNQNMNDPVDHVFALHAAHMNQNLFLSAHTHSRLSCHYFSYGDRERVLGDLSRQEEQTMSLDALNAERHSWLYGLVLNMVDYFSKNHEFYKNPDRHYREKGLLITNHLEDSRLKGYRPVYLESQDSWPSLEGQNIRMLSQHRDLEPFLREQGVGQCVLLDATRHEAQLIGPYDRFHTFYQEYRSTLREHDITETQLRVRLFALEQQLKEHPQSAHGMVSSRSYDQLLEHETRLRPELMKTHDEHTATQMLYHLERTGSLPTDKDLHQIQQRVNHALDQFSAHQHDKIFEASLPSSSQKQIQFQKEHQRGMER